MNSGFGAVKSSVVISHFLMKLVVFLNGLHVHVIDVWWIFRVLICINVVSVVEKIYRTFF